MSVNLSTIPSGEIILNMELAEAMKKMADAFTASTVSHSALREEYGLGKGSRVLELSKIKDDKSVDIINQFNAFEEALSIKLPKNH